MRDIVMLRDLRAADAASAGAKAANLGELISAGVPVPDGFCLPTHVYRDTAGPVLAPALDLLVAGLAQGEKEDQLAVILSELRETVGSVELSAELLAKLREAHRWLCPDGGSVAVRSSGTSEDSAAASFAGQYHTELGVRSFDDVVDAVRKCWASLWEPHAFRYRERQGVAHQDAAMAVVVQAMAPADSAGVMFTRDPHDPPPTAEPVASASAGSVVIESSWGIGEAVVSGIVTPDRYRVSRGDHRVESCEVSAKSRMVVPTSGEDRSGGGTAVVDVPEARREAASLTSAQAVELARHGLAIEARFGRPQDVEWVLSDGRISVLQARPLTHREPAPAVPPDVRWESPVDGAWWARISICDSWLPEPLSPLFATTLFPCLVVNWLRNWAGSVAEQSDNPLIPRPMAGTINGFGYLRLDYPMNKYPLRTVKLAMNCYKFHLGRLERRWRTLILPRHVQRLEAMRRQDPSALSTDELLALIDEAQELSGRYWAILGGLAWYWNAGEWLLAQLYPRLTRQLTLDGVELPGHGVLLQGFPARPPRPTARSTGWHAPTPTRPNRSAGSRSCSTGTAIRSTTSTSPNRPRPTTPRRSAPPWRPTATAAPRTPSNGCGHSPHAGTRPADASTPHCAARPSSATPSRRCCAGTAATDRSVTTPCSTSRSAGPSSGAAMSNSAAAWPRRARSTPPRTSSS